MSNFRLGAALPVFVAGLLAVSQADAQEGPVTFEFSFANPGARSTALGGAFAALADDATAAFANPAGLVQLIEPEVSAEYRRSTYSTPFVQGGRANGSPSGEGVDTTAGLRPGVFDSETDSLSFASFVWPRKRWSLAVYRHTWADFQVSSQVNGLFGVEDGETVRSEDIRATTDIEVVNTGVAVGFELGKKFSLGLSAFNSQGIINSDSNEFRQDEDDFFGQNPFRPEFLDTRYQFLADDTFVGYSAGFLYRPNEHFSFGGYFRSGPEFDLRVIETTGPANDEEEAGVIELDAITPLGLPDVYGAGFAVRAAGGRFTASFEWARILYSSITNSLDTNVFDAGQIQLPDGDEFHLGFEYVFIQMQPILAVRAGAWIEPAHRVGSGPEAGLFERTIFSTGKDQTHVSGGFGLVWNRVQLDLGVDVSDSTEIVSLSVVVRL